MQIPADAWVMDFVLSESADGGSFYDTNGGMDYHIDVTGSSVPPQPLNVVHVAVEMAPIAKAGPLDPFLNDGEIAWPLNLLSTYGFVSIRVIPLQ